MTEVSQHSTERKEQKNQKDAMVSKLGGEKRMPREGTISKQEWLPVKYCRESGTWVWKEATVSDNIRPLQTATWRADL